MVQVQERLTKRSLTVRKKVNEDPEGDRIINSIHSLPHFIKTIVIGIIIKRVQSNQMVTSWLGSSVPQ